MTGVELVRGNYHANAGAFILEGYEKKDPNGILGLDKYRLVVSDNRGSSAALPGITAPGPVNSFSPSDAEYLPLSQCEDDASAPRCTEHLHKAS